MTLRKSMILDWSPLHESVLKMDLQFHNLLITDLSAHISIDHLFPMRTRGWKLKPVIVILSYLEPTGGY
jgi:hypothetical protein